MDNVRGLYVTLHVVQDGMKGLLALINVALLLLFFSTNAKSFCASNSSGFVD
jgi:hypothetical protein